MKTIIKTGLAVFILFIVFSCTKENSIIQSSNITAESTVVSDESAQRAFITIGTQVWMKRDLTTSFYRNGDPIPQVQVPAAWASLTTGAWCWYRNNPAMGKLYNWYAVNDPRGLAPAGWHVPSDEEWTILTNYLGGASVAGGKMKETGTTHWEPPNTDATNTSGFTGLPGGNRLNYGSFNTIGDYGNWWSSTEVNSYPGYALYRNLYYNDGVLYKGSAKAHYGFSVRCIKDVQPEIYDSVIIGSQVWMVKNLDVTRYRNGDSIPQVTDPNVWASLTTGAWCWYNNDSANGKIYGKVYNWYAVTDPRGLAPAGWHIPSDAEWTTLTTYLGGLAVAGGKMKEAGTAHWYAPNTDATNSSGFTGLPGGYRHYIGSFFYIGSYGYWWSSTEYSTTTAWSRYLNYSSGYVFRYYNLKPCGFSVRCLKD